MSSLLLFLLLNYPLSMISFYKLIQNILPITLISEPAVLHWDRILHKNVRSSDGQDLVNVDAVDADSVVIITGGAVKNTGYENSKSMDSMGQRYS
jgi:hypothetical protein